MASERKTFRCGTDRPEKRKLRKCGTGKAKKCGKGKAKENSSGLVIVVGILQSQSKNNDVTRCAADGAIHSPVPAGRLGT